MSHGQTVRGRHTGGARGLSALATITSAFAAVSLASSAWRARRTGVRVAPPAESSTFVPPEPTGIVGRLDETQRRVAPLSFAAGVFKKFSDDGGGQMAAQLTYSGFLSLFPLLLVLTTVLGYILSGHPGLQDRVLHSALVQFPIIGDQLGSNVSSLKGSVPALIVGVLGAMWGGLGVTKAAQEVVANVWMVPRRARPGFLPRLGKAVAVLATLGVGLAATSLATAAGSQLVPIGWAGRVAAVGASTVVATVFFAFAFKLLMPVRIGWREALPGAATAAVGWQILLLFGTALVQHQLRGATQSYGFFGIVLGLLAWVALLSTVFVLSAEVNAVYAHRLWPRSLATPGLTPDDRRALTALARVEERAKGERVEVSFADPTSEPPDAAEG
jgi:YihY family inner membrane protein